MSDRSRRLNYGSRLGSPHKVVGNDSSLVGNDSRTDCSVFHVDQMGSEYGSEECD